MSPRFWLYPFILLALGCATASADWKNLEPEKSPFWRTKEKLSEKIYRQRFILALVSVQKQKAEKSSSSRLKILGAGLVHAPHHFTLENIQRFDELSQDSGVLREARYEADLAEWFLGLEALNFKTSMKVMIKESKGDKKSLFRFRVREGALKGLEGVLELVDFEAQKTEIALTAYYDYDTFPLPEVFTKLGMEFVLQKIAERMRSTVEEKYRRMRTEASQ